MSNSQAAENKEADLLRLGKSVERGRPGSSGQDSYRIGVDMWLALNVALYRAGQESGALHGRAKL